MKVVDISNFNKYLENEIDFIIELLKEYVTLQLQNQENLNLLNTLATYNNFETSNIELAFRQTEDMLEEFQLPSQLVLPLVLYKTEFLKSKLLMPTLLLLPWS